MVRMNKIVDGKDTPGSAKDAGNALLSHFGFKSTGRKGKKGPKFPVKKAGRTCKAVSTGQPRNMAANEANSESVLMLPYKDDVKEGSIDIVEAVTCEYDKDAKKEICDMDDEALPLEEGGKKASKENTVDALVD